MLGVVPHAVAIKSGKKKSTKIDFLSPETVRCGVVEVSHAEGWGPGKKKHININKVAGLSRDWVGGKNLFMCFFVQVISYGEEKNT